MSLEPLRPGEVVERYEVESVLGEGGMAAWRRCTGCGTARSARSTR